MATTRHVPVSEDGEHFVCDRCGEHLADDQIGASQDVPLCARRSVAWRCDAASIEQYLQDEEAVHDVARLLAEPDPKFKGTTDGDALFYLERGTAGAWRTVELDQVRGPENVKVYYRLEGDRSIVTDLGEAVRALRLRTGHASLRWSDLPDFRMPAGAYGTEDRLIYAEPNPSSADLPRAICCVMLAAWRIANIALPAAAG